MRSYARHPPVQRTDSKFIIANGGIDLPCHSKQVSLSQTIMWYDRTGCPAIAYGIQTTDSVRITSHTGVCFRHSRTQFLLQPSICSLADISEMSQSPFKLASIHATTCNGIPYPRFHLFFIRKITACRVSIPLRAIQGGCRPLLLIEHPSHPDGVGLHRHRRHTLLFTGNQQEKQKRYIKNSVFHS